MKWDVSFYSADDALICWVQVECAKAHNAAKVAIREKVADDYVKACIDAARVDVRSAE